MHCLDGVDHDPVSMQLISNEGLSVPKWNPCLHIYEIDSWNCQADFEGGVTNSVLLNSVGEEHTISAKHRNDKIQLVCMYVYKCLCQWEVQLIPLQVATCALGYLVTPKQITST